MAIPDAKPNCLFLTSRPRFHNSRSRGWIIRFVYCSDERSNILDEYSSFSREVMEEERCQCFIWQSLDEVTENQLKRNKFRWGGGPQKEKFKGEEDAPVEFSEFQRRKEFEWAFSLSFHIDLVALSFLLVIARLSQLTAEIISFKSKHSIADTTGSRSNNERRSNTTHNLHEPPLRRGNRTFPKFPFSRSALPPYIYIKLSLLKHLRHRRLTSENGYQPQLQTTQWIFFPLSMFYLFLH